MCAINVYAQLETRDKELKATKQKLKAMGGERDAWRGRCEKVKGVLASAGELLGKEMPAGMDA